ncbi:hypothetical protein ACOBV9_18300 (plasmid) [Pseudoalteromonas espejiana]
MKSIYYFNEADMSFSHKIKKITYALTSKTAMLIIGFLALSLLIWFGGPLIAIAEFVPLASVAARLLTILFVILVFAITKILQLNAAK